MAYKKLSECIELTEIAHDDWIAVGDSSDSNVLKKVAPLTFRGGMVNATDYGSIGQAAIEAAIAAIDTDDTALVITPGTWEISNDLTIPANIVVVVIRGAVFEISNTKTLTINGPFEAGLYQVFSDSNTDNDGVFFGAGSAKEVYPEWWGGAGDNTDLDGTGTDNAGPVIAASKSGAKIVKFSDGCYGFSSSVVIDSASQRGVRFVGSGNITGVYLSPNNNDLGTGGAVSGANSLFVFKIANNQVCFENLRFHPGVGISFSGYAIYAPNSGDYKSWWEGQIRNCRVNMSSISSFFYGDIQSCKIENLTSEYCSTTFRILDNASADIQFNDCLVYQPYGPFIHAEGTSASAEKYIANLQINNLNIQSHRQVSAIEAHYVKGLQISNYNLEPRYNATATNMIGLELENCESVIVDGLNIENTFTTATEWETGTAYTAGDVRYYGSVAYRAANSDTSGATPPTHWTGSASDGAVTWEAIGWANTTTGNISHGIKCTSSELIVNGGRIKNCAYGLGVYGDGNKISLNGVMINETSIITAGRNIYMHDAGGYLKATGCAFDRPKHEWIFGDGTNTIDLSLVGCRFTDPRYNGTTNYGIQPTTSGNIIIDGCKMLKTDDISKIGATRAFIYLDAGNKVVVTNNVEDSGMTGVIPIVFNGVTTLMVANNSWQPRTGTASPVASVTPYGVGEIYIDTTGNKTYIADGTGNTDWQGLN